VSSSYEISRATALAELARLHKLAIPSDPATHGELVRHYTDLAEPVATIAAEVLALRVQMLEYAREQAYIWAHLGSAEQREQIEAHLESEFGADLSFDDDLMAAVIDEVLP
jgi:hypothetical protein